MQISKRQQQIMMEAVKLIASGGIQNLTMKNIAEAVGVSEPALYRHFKSKNDILKLIIQTLKQGSRQALDSGQSGWMLIRGTLQQHVEQFTRTPGFAAIIFSEEIFSAENELSQEIVNLMQSTLAQFESMIKAAQEQGDIRNDISAKQLASMIIGTFRFLITRWHLSGNTFDLRAEATRLFDDLTLIINA